MKIGIFKPSIVFGGLVAALVVYAYFHFFGAYLPEYGKGGVGAAGYDSYVMTSGEVNAVICGKKRWVGRARSDSQTVSCTGTQVSQFQMGELLDAELVFQFTPTRIRVFDVKRFKGGYYLRTSEEKTSTGPLQVGPFATK
jgi:hypothetical protein